MKKKYALVMLLSALLYTNTAFADDLSKGLNEAINKSNIKNSSVSVSIKYIDTKVPAYELNQNIPIPPASTQKIVTTLPAIKTLGQNYKFTTKLYKNTLGDYLFVLGADPYLTTEDLSKLIQKMPPEIKSISIDDSILDKKEWGEGWQWDDDLNPLMPKFSAYNLDKNIINLDMEPTSEGAPALLTFEKSYPTTFINQLITSTSTNYSLDRKIYETPDVISVNGTISKTVVVPIPVNSPKKYFKLRLTDVLINAEKSNSGVFLEKKLNKNYFYVDKITHSLTTAENDILKNSNNMVAETVFKLAGGKYKHSAGSFNAGLEMFNNYCKNNNLDTTRINIVDASGVSKNNLMVADFMTDFLIKNKQDIEPMLATAGEGTLTNRVLYLKGNLKAKTGTLSNISAITGFLSTQNGHKYAFCIMINDAKTSSKDKKLLEDTLIKTIYLKG